MSLQTHPHYFSTRHSLVSIVFAAIGGFFLAFVLFLALTLSTPLFGDILIGSIPVDRTHPTIMNAAMHTTEFVAATKALGSFWFWSLVIFFGTFFAIFILQFIRTQRGGALA